MCMKEVSFLFQEGRQAFFLNFKIRKRHYTVVWKGIEVKISRKYAEN